MASEIERLQRIEAAAQELVGTMGTPDAIDEAEANAMLVAIAEEGEG